MIKFVFIAAASFFAFAATSFFIIRGLPTAHAGPDCVYRITGSDPIRVTPSGITGKMKCSSKQIDEIVAAVSKGMADEKSNDAIVEIGDLSFFWHARHEVAKSLAEDNSWDSAAGGTKAGAKGGAVSAAIIEVFEPMFTKHKYRVASASLENMTVEDAAKQGFKTVKGKFPYEGKIALTITKSSL